MTLNCFLLKILEKFRDYPKCFNIRKKGIFQKLVYNKLKLNISLHFSIYKQGFIGNYVVVVKLLSHTLLLVTS